MRGFSTCRTGTVSDCHYWTTVLLTWDEAATNDGPIGMIVLSPDSRGNGYNNAIHYTHSSTVRTIEQVFGVSPLLRDAQNATDLSDLFRTFP
jgi:phosphatidylinositol-3-phosphatase